MQFLFTTPPAVHLKLTFTSKNSILPLNIFISYISPTFNCSSFIFLLPLHDCYKRHFDIVEENNSISDWQEFIKLYVLNYVWFLIDLKDKPISFIHALITSLRFIAMGLREKDQDIKVTANSTTITYSLSSEQCFSVVFLRFDWQHFKILSPGRRGN